MESNKWAKQVFDFNKAVFEKSYTIGVAMQDQAENMFNAWIDRINIREENKKAMTEWLNACKQCRDELKKNIDEGYQHMEGILQTR